MHRYHVPDLHSPFALCHQLTQLLYYALTGFAPFEPEEVRLSGFHPIPVSVAVPSLDRKSAAAIDSILSLSPAKQREAVSSAYSACENLKWFDEHCPIPVTPPHSVGEGGQLKEYREQLMIKGRRREFWRKKGFGIIAAVIAAVLLISVSVQAVLKANEPPYTAGMSREEIIEEFFLSQNELDVTRMNASLGRGVKNPFEQQVTTLFVNSRVRQAYEGVDSVISPQEFEEEGRNSLEPTVMLYGVTDLTIEQSGEDSYIARYLLYTPDTGESEEMSEAYTGVEVAFEVEFTFTEKKEYSLISGIRELGHEVIRQVSIPWKR